jgi:alanine dehydrogenase
LWRRVGCDWITRTKMTSPFKLGLARMHHEFGEKRDFLPNFVASLAKVGADVALEYGYGSGIGFTEEDYLAVCPEATFVSREEVYKQDIVLVLRCPDEKDLRMLKPGACIMSMLHYGTRPQRVALLRSLGVEAISLDSIRDDVGRRLIEQLRTVAWNGLEVAFRVLLRTFPPPGMESPRRAPVHATVMGIGAVGMHAVQAASRYGDMALWRSLAQRGTPGVVVTAVEFDVTRDETMMRDILRRTDILVDATQRPDVSQPVIPNEWIGDMPEHAVLLDLSVDPYDCSADKPEVKGIEGMPQGNLDQYVFAPDDPAFERVPTCVATKNRRYSVSCYSWPGIHPKECMDHYGRQIGPVLRRLIEKGGVQNISPKGRYMERALTRAMLSRLDEQG